MPGTTNGEQIRVLDIRSNLPTLMKKGVSELNMDDEIIEGLAGARFVNGQLVLKVRKNKLPPAEASRGMALQRKTIVKREVGRDSEGKDMQNHT